MTGKRFLELLDEWGGGDAPREFVIETDRLEVRIHVAAADRLGCALSSLRIGLREPDRLDSDTLTAWGKRIAQRLRYLLEDIETVELDSQEGRLLLRSSPPERKQDATLYYELLLDATGTLDLNRWRFQHETRSRTAQRLNFTREVAEKLVDDLVAVAP